MANTKLNLRVKNINPTKALIGCTGFVGSNLASQAEYTDFFNSKNFESMRGQHFNEVVCAGVSAVKWKANKDPGADWAGIEQLLDVLKTVTADRFILISTIDVYATTKALDESFDCGSVENHAYGRHRLAVEAFCQAHFANCFVVRLPGLFGKNLKKNVIFDLLNDNCLEMINPASSIQYYDLKHLTADVERAVKSEIRLINLFNEAVPSSEIIERFFPEKTVGQNAVGEVHYDLHTRHAAIRGRADSPYLYSKDEVLADMELFIKEQQKGAGV